MDPIIRLFGAQLHSGQLTGGFRQSGAETKKFIAAKPFFRRSKGSPGAMAGGMSGYYRPESSPVNEGFADQCAALLIRRLRTRRSAMAELAKRPGARTPCNNDIFPQAKTQRLLGTFSWRF